MNDKWISVKDRLPDNKDWVLICTDDDYCPMAIALYESSIGKWIRWGEFWDYDTPSHWQPLPAPPKDGE